MIGPMRRPLPWILGFSLVLVAGLAVALRDPAVPLGVRGEWEWPRLPATIDRGLPAPAILGVAAYAAFAALGARDLGRRPGRPRESAWLLALAPAAIGVQLALLAGAPEGYGLTKWVTIDQPGASGYFGLARAEMADVGGFLARYPAWIQGQDALHIGTHPPGLFLASKAALAAMESRPGAARSIVGALPASVQGGFRDILGPRPVAERAAIALIGAATLLACALAALPVYALARATLPAPSAWAAAALWPVVPAAILFQPTSDTAFPLLSASALALASWSCRSHPARWGWPLAAGAGLMLGVGMQFSLVFLGVGLIAALVYATFPGVPARGRLLRLMATGAGFLAVTSGVWVAYGANPFAIWWWNQRKHAEFYANYPRSYAAWMAANPIELAVAIGLPLAVLALVGLGTRRAPQVGWATVLVLVLLTVGGRNLSEVARLWLPFCPPLVVAAASGLARLEAGPAALAATVALVAAQTLLLELAIQVVYPF